MNSINNGGLHMLTKSQEEAIKQEQGEKEELKVRGFRLDEETHQAFKQIAEQIGGNQQHAFEVLISTYKEQADRVNFKEPGKLDEFENYLSGLKTMFVEAIRSGDDAKILARQDFVTQLESKDNIISTLQESLKAAVEAEQEAERNRKPLEDEILQLKETVKSLKEKLSGSEDTISECKTSIEDLKKELKDAKESDNNTRRLYEEGVANATKLRNEIDRLERDSKPIKDNLSKVAAENRVLENEKTSLEKEVLELNKDIESLKASHSAELELVRSQAELKTKEEMYKQIEEMRKELDQAKDKYMALLEEKKTGKKNDQK